MQPLHYKPRTQQHTTLFIDLAATFVWITSVVD